MSQVKQVGDIQVDQDLPFQQKEWSVERVGWAVGLLLLLAALLGLFGVGPFSSTSIEQGGLTVNYNRTARYKAPTELVVEAGQEQIADGTLRIQIERGYLEQFQIESISPQPDTTQLTPDWIIYEFQVEDPGQPVKVSYQLQPDKFGAVDGRLMSQNQDINFNQFIFP